MKTIVVGIDGSAGSVRALEFALAEARLRGSKLKAVEVWHIPASVYSGGGLAPVVTDPDEFEGFAKERLDEVLQSVAAQAEGVEVERIVREGQPAEVLVEAAEDAELLVVGSRGLGGFRGLLLGSVGQQCAHHARCPVVIVPKAT
ncbi:MAG TPA: universal stress protein [Gaiellaceae bacterium]|nr:universal stress protein [Gaiellaceae bacterium]